MSVDYYTRLERGNLTGASEAVLDALARALQLDEAERAHLYDLGPRFPAERSAATLHQAERALSDLVGELSIRSEEFRGLWATHNVRLHTKGEKRFNHPVVGELDSPCASRIGDSLDVLLAIEIRREKRGQARETAGTKARQTEGDGGEQVTARAPCLLRVRVLPPPEPATPTVSGRSFGSSSRTSNESTR